MDKNLKGGAYPLSNNGSNMNRSDLHKERSCWSVPDPYSQYTQTSQTPLTVAFFAPKNIDFLRTKVTQMFLDKYGLDIGVQPYKPTEIFALKAFNDVSCDMEQFTDIPNKAAWMNQYTLKGLLERIARNLGQHIGYLRFTDEAAYKPKISRPILTRRPDRKVQSLSRYYNGCDYQI